jgi:hypothetical protein
MSHAARSNRQRAFYFRVTANFLVFCLLAAPLSFHVSWYGGLTNASADWFSSALASGPLYFYAFVLCLEANLRLEHYPSLLFNDWRKYLLRVLLLVPLLLAGSQYFISPYYRAVGAPLPYFERVTQMSTAFLALVLSTVVHHFVASFETQRMR